MNTSMGQVLTGTGTHRGRPALRIRNGLIEALVVPAIGRLMSLSLRGGENVLWENPFLDAPAADEMTEAWINHGGDKVWPSPQDRWETVTGRPWPPPEALDARPHEGLLEDQALVMISGVDPRYGIQSLRRFTMAPRVPALQVSTRFRKLTGAPIRAGIWTITQARDPERVFAWLPEARAMGEAFMQQMGPTPQDLSIQGRVLGLSRDPHAHTKIGMEATSLLWVGDQAVLRVDAPETDAPRAPGGDAREFPDGGSRTELYTSPDPLPYVELETLGPLATLACGQEIQWTTTYTLHPRTRTTALEEARLAFGG